MAPSTRRTIHFFASADKAKRELGWEPKHSFLDDVTGLVADYQRQGRQVRGRAGTVDFRTRWGAADCCKVTIEPLHAYKTTLYTYKALDLLPTQPPSVLPLPQTTPCAPPQNKSVDFAIDDKILTAVRH